jgi:hypothetical protein
MDNNTNIPIQLTFDDYGHTLHHCQIESFDQKYLVFDTRNDDTKIGETCSIQILDVNTLEIKTIYSTKNQTIYGPGVGAATFSPKENKVMFIHGIRNCNQTNPYSATRRTGVCVDIASPNKTIFMDARNINSPYTNGALRGGTHSHSWNKNNGWISFTYNDYILEQNSKIDDRINDQRVVGIMFPKKVIVDNDNSLENNSGEMFSVLVTKVHTNPCLGSDEIEKAFDECWINNSTNVAFQGHVRDENGNLKTEIFIANIPNEIKISEDDNLLGTERTLPNVPKFITQRRVTKTNKGISNLRHWLRSSPDGKIIYFLKEDECNITQLYGVDIENNLITQYSYLEKSITSPFNLSVDGKYAILFSFDKIIVIDISKRTSKTVFNSLEHNTDLTGIPSFSMSGKYIYFNQFVPNINNQKFIQVFKLKIDF